MLPWKGSQQNTFSLARCGASLSLFGSQISLPSLFLPCIWCDSNTERHPSITSTTLDQKGGLQLPTYPFASATFLSSCGHPSPIQQLRKKRFQHEQQMATWQNLCRGAGDGELPSPVLLCKQARSQRKGRRMQTASAASGTHPDCLETDMSDKSYR